MVDHDDVKSSTVASGAPASRALARLGLDAPLHELARPRLDEWAVRRIWEGVQRRRAVRVGEPRRLVALAAFAAVASMLALFIAGWQLVQSRHAPPSSRRANAPAASAPGQPDASGLEASREMPVAPLLTRDARPFALLDVPAAPASAPSTSRAASTPRAPRAAMARVDFNDGSSIEASPGTRVEAIESRPDEFAVALRRGWAQFRVTPGGPRRWRIESSHARVEVLGTTLWVETDAGGTSVGVDVGSVLVRSPELPGGSQGLGAGESLRLGAVPARALEMPPEPSRDEAARSGSAAGERAETGGPRSRRVTASAAAALWEQVDEARRGDEPERAAALLARLLEHHPGDSQVALAAFTLGLLQLERLDRPFEAAESFQRALELGIGAALRDDAYLRWAEALSRLRDGAQVAMVSAEYARLYPRGRQRAAIERLAQAAPSGSPTGPASRAKGSPPSTSRPARDVP